MENFTKNELWKRLQEKCARMGILSETINKKHIFGAFETNVIGFQFLESERSLIYKAIDKLKSSNFDLSPCADKRIIENAKKVKHWFCDDEPGEDAARTFAPQNLLNRMMEASNKNLHRPKQGFRYDDDFKRFCVYNRLLSGPMAFKSLQLNLKGCFPSISTTNRYVHRSDHAIVEGNLRVDELLVYLKARNQPLWVALSEDATRIENRLQYDSRTNQIIGFCLPINTDGMPIPFCFKARTASEIIKQFSSDISVANFVNVIIAKPIGTATSFCLLIYGTDSRNTADDISKRWIYVTKELNKVGISVLSISSDSDPKNNAAMRKNSNLGKDSNDLSGLFKCGKMFGPPFYFQDYPHVATKLRNLLLKTIEEAEKLPFGDYFIQQHHLQELLKHFGKDEHLLTATVLNPVDRMNFNSAQRICADKVIKLLEQNVEGSNGTAVFLQIMSDSIAAFDNKSLSPLERVEKLWHAVFLVRIWRNFILSTPGFTLKNNFMSSFSYYCMEQNAHALVLTLLYLKKNSLTHLFSPHMFCSQPCESFFRQLRSFTSTNSTVVNFSTKEILNRISRIQLLSEISNDSEFEFPKSLNSRNVPNAICQEFPNEKEITTVIQKSRNKAIEKALKIGLIKKKPKSNDICICCVPPYDLNFAVARKKNDETISFEDTDERFNELEMKLFSANLKNYAHKFEANSLSETSNYVEFDAENRRCVFKKTSVCWLFRKENNKCSSDRKYRVRNPASFKGIKSNKSKPVKTYKIYKNIILNKNKKARKV